jgi:tetratricopeptide (TPR) repeat protein
MPIITETELTGNARSLWLKALSALEMRNLDYAINLLQASVKEAPTFLDGRKALRQAAIQKKKAEKKKLFQLSSGSLGTMKIKNRLKSDPEGAMAEVEDVLKDDPFNIDANDILYQAAMRLGLPEIASFALETVRQGHPENTRKAHELAQHYMQLDDPEKASNVYRDIVKRDPTDMDAVKGEKDAVARSSMRKGRWEEGFKASMKNEEETKSLEAGAKTGMTKEQLDQLLESALAEYAQAQNNIAVVKKVAELYERSEDWANAASFYAWAFHLSTGDVSLERKAAAMEERRIEEDIRTMEREIEALGDTPEAAEKAEVLHNLKVERSRKMIAEARDRVERNPTDPQLRFELGQHLYNADEFQEAIPHLQRARNNPHIRTRALLLLGRCYEARNMLDLAEGQLKEALSELLAMDGTKKDVLYTLALVCEKMGKHEDYLENLKRIYEADYGYRDVAKRVESSYGG